VIGACTWCGSLLHDRAGCKFLRDSTQAETFVSPHPYASCGVDCRRRTVHCAAHCGFDRADPIHNVPNEAVLEVA
jgi:hypothetical protein